MELKDPRNACSRYPYEDTMIICPFCGKKMGSRLMYTNKQQKAICCFGEDGCRRFSVKTWMLDECIREAFDHVEMEKIVGRGEGIRDMRAAKEKGISGKIEYWFLDDTVKQVSFIPHRKQRIQKHKKQPATKETVFDWDVRIDWKCGMTSIVALPHNERYSEEPTHVASLYRQRIKRLLSINNQPKRPNGLAERRLMDKKHVIRYDPAIGQLPEGGV